MLPAGHSADGIGVFDIAQSKIVRVLKAGSDPETFDVSEDGTQLYISNEDDAAVSVVDVASGTVVKSAKVGSQPECVKVTPDHRHGDRLNVVGSVEAGPRPWGIWLSPDGKTLCPANGPSNGISVVDVSTNTVNKKVNAGGSPWGVIAWERIFSLRTLLSLRRFSDAKARILRKYRKPIKVQDGPGGWI